MPHADIQGRPTYEAKGGDCLGWQDLQGKQISLQGMPHPVVPPEAVARLYLPLQQSLGEQEALLVSLHPYSLLLLPWLGKGAPFCSLPQVPKCHEPALLLPRLSLAPPHIG